MFAYRTPGVYFEVADNRSEAVGLVRTDIAGFVGIAPRGPLHRPVKVESWTQFVSLFGSHTPYAYLAYAVEGFFANGGATCWIVRVADPDTARPSRAGLMDDRGQPAVRLEASCRIDNAGALENDLEPAPGVWGDQITATVRTQGPDRFSLSLACPGVATEVYRGLSLDRDDDRFIVDILNGPPPAPRTLRNRAVRLRTVAPTPGGSRLIRATDLRKDPVAGRTFLIESVYQLSGGRDGLAASAVLADVNGDDRLQFVAAPGSGFGRLILIEITVPHDSNPPPESQRFDLTVQDLGARPNIVREEWKGLSLDPSDARYVATVVNNRRKGVKAGGGSELVRVRDLTPKAPKNVRPRPSASGAKRPTRPVPGSYRLQGGMTPTHLSGQGDLSGRTLGLSTLESIDEVSIVAMPDLAPPQSLPPRPVKDRPIPCDRLEPATGIGQPPVVPEVPPETAPIFTPDQIRALYDALILHAEQLRDRVVLIDPPAEIVRAALPSRGASVASGDGDDVQRIQDWLDDQGFTSKYAAVYYPWVRVGDPLALEGSVRSVPPSGHVAGVFARTDRDFGVHKPPANIEVLGVRDVTDRLDDLVHGDLNERGVNVIRAYPGRGIRIAGARTLSSETEWRFLNVRRLLLMIESAIGRQTHWVVFEPHNLGLRDDLDRVIRSFLDDLWRRGMLDGATANDAYEVRCDESTNPPEEVDAGRLICLVGVQPPAPAEFVVIRIGKTREGSVVLEDSARG